MSRVSVCVACRVRPLAEADETFVTLHNKTVYIRDPDQPHLTPQVFGFDCGFGAHATNRNVYEEVAMPVLQQALQKVQQENAALKQQYLASHAQLSSASQQIDSCVANLEQSAMQCERWSMSAVA